MNAGLQKQDAVLVTGGAGFIGSHLAARLSNDGHRVIIVDDFSGGDGSNIEYFKISPQIVQGSVADQQIWKSLEEYDIKAIFHLASRADTSYSVRSPLQDCDVNVIGTLLMLEFARRHDCTITFVSSAAVYSEEAPYPTNENAPLGPSSPYGAAKMAAEAYCSAYSRCHNLRIVIARFFNVFGPLMSKYVIYDLVRKLQKSPGRLDIRGDGNQVRDYVYIDDAIDALMLLYKAGRTGEVYNVASGTPLRIRDLAESIADAMKLKQVSFAFDNCNPPGVAKTLYGDASRIAKLGYAPRVHFAAGLKKTVEFLTSHEARPLRRNLVPASG